MASNLSNPVKTQPNEPRDLQARLYREIGISAVAAALESATYPVTQATAPERKHRLAGKAA